MAVSTDLLLGQPRQGEKQLGDEKELKRRFYHGGGDYAGARLKQPAAPLFLRAGPQKSAGTKRWPGCPTAMPA